MPGLTAQAALAKVRSNYFAPHFFLPFSWSALQILRLSPGTATLQPRNFAFSFVDSSALANVRTLSDKAKWLEGLAANPNWQDDQLHTTEIPSIHLRIFRTNNCQNTPDSARPMPRREIPKNETAIRNQWPIGKSLRCRRNELLKLWGASANEQILVEMPAAWHERIHAQLTEWTNEPMSHWMIQWTNESMSWCISEAMHQSMYRGFSELMTEWLCRWITETMNQWVNESSEHSVLCTFWLGNVPRATSACIFSKAQLPKMLQPHHVFTLLTSNYASRRNSVNFSTSQFQKRSGHEVLCAFGLRHLLDTTTCTFSTSQLPKALRKWGALCILTLICASRDNGVQLFISHLARWLRTCCFSKPTFSTLRSPKTLNKYSASQLFYLFAPDPFSSLIFFHVLFSSLTLPASAFSSVHSVGSLTSKLPR